jgi:hypothetical protein
VSTDLAHTAPGAGGLTHLRISYVWRDELMADTLVPSGQVVALGTGKAATVTVADLGLPNDYVLLRPSTEGYVLTLAQTMGGRLILDGENTDIAALLEDTSAARAGGVTSGFYATAIGPRDSGMIDLDGRGEHIVAFQFVTPDGPLPPPPLGRDSELMMPALAFAVILFTVLVAMTYLLHVPGNSLIFPGAAELMTNYLVQRPPPPQPPAPNAEEAASKDGEKENVNSATQGKEGKEGGEGEKPRARDPDPGDIPPQIETGLLSKESRKVLQNVRNPALDNRLKASLARLQGKRLTGGLGQGTGTGIGFGPGQDGTGTTRGGRGGGPGGGGSVQGDFVSQGKVDVGETRSPRGTGGGGRGAREVAVVQTGSASGDFSGLTKAEIDRVVKSRSGLMKACYQRELNRAPGLGGTLVVTFRIKADGTVQSARVVPGKSTLRNSSVESCVTRQITGLKFPAKGGGVVNYPLIFSQG